MEKCELLIFADEQASAISPRSLEKLWRLVLLARRLAEPWRTK